jgi:hypothetical protein
MVLPLTGLQQILTSRLCWKGKASLAYLGGLGLIPEQFDFIVTQSAQEISFAREMSFIISRMRGSSICDGTFNAKT